MSETQPDMLGGKAVPASRLRRGRPASAPITRHGWADKPGSGPAGETCGSCTYCGAFQFRKTYYKCTAREGDHWKGGRATDIRPLDPACSKWSGRIKEVRPPNPPVPAAPPPSPPRPRASEAQPTRKPADEAQHAFQW